MAGHAVPPFRESASGCGGVLESEPELEEKLMEYLIGLWRGGLPHRVLLFFLLIKAASRHRLKSCIIAETGARRLDFAGVRIFLGNLPGLGRFGRQKNLRCCSGRSTSVTACSRRHQADRMACLRRWTWAAISVKPLKGAVLQITRLKPRRNQYRCSKPKSAINFRFCARGGARGHLEWAPSCWRAHR
jgi:hypothetical protein